MRHHTEEHAVDTEDDADHGGGTVREVLITIIAALALAFIVQAVAVKPFRIPSGSMENTLKCGDRVLVDRLTYHWASPGRGDVVVFHPPALSEADGKFDPERVAGEDGLPPRDDDGTTTIHKADVNYIKRIIGLPGDKVEVKKHHAFIDGKKLKEPYLHPLADKNGISSRSEWGPQTVPKGMYLMLGDHRDNSADGRVFGFVPRSFIIGKTFLVYWPPSRFGGVPKKDPGGPESSKPDPNCLENAGLVPAGQDH